MPAERRRQHLRAIAVALLVGAMIAAAAVARARFLLADPYPVGIDGHYYAVQLQSLLASGKLAYAASPLTFWLFAPFAAWLGPVAGVKVGAAIGTALAAWPAYHLGKRAGGSQVAGLFGAALVATSPSSMFLSAEFVKQGLGLTIALAQLAVLASAMASTATATTPSARWRWVVAALLAVAALLVHKSSFALVVLVGGLALAVDHRISRRVAIACGIALVVEFGASLLVPGLPGLRDLAVVGNAFTASPEVLLPALARGRHVLSFGYEALIAMVAALAAAALYVRARRAGRALSPLIPGIIVFAVIQGLPWLDVSDVQGLAFRLRVSAFIALPLLVPFIVDEVAAWLGWQGAARFMPQVAFALTLFGARDLAHAEGVSGAHPALVEAARAVAGAVPANAEVITQDRQLAFMVRFHAGVHTRLHPEDAPDGMPRYRLFSGNLITPELRAAVDELWRAPPAGVTVPVTLHPWSAQGALIMTEATWQLLRSRLAEPARAHYDAWPTT